MMESIDSTSAANGSLAVETVLIAAGPASAASASIRMNLFMREPLFRAAPGPPGPKQRSADTVVLDAGSVLRLSTNSVRCFRY